MNARQIETEARHAGFFLAIGFAIVGALVTAAGGLLVGGPMALLGVAGFITNVLCRRGS
jgi:hypothetical protein